MSICFVAHCALLIFGTYASDEILLYGEILDYVSKNPAKNFVYGDNITNIRYSSVYGGVIISTKKTCCHFYLLIVNRATRSSIEIKKY